MKHFLLSLSEKNASVSFDEDLRKHTSFKIGGRAKFFVVVHNLKTLKLVVSKTKRYFILGAGTNILFKDKAYNGVIIKLGRDFNKIKIVENNCVEIGAGVNLFALNKFLKDNSIGGMEWSFGIPGTVGGAVVMNAGAFDNEMGNFVKKVKVFDGKRSFWRKNISFAYRASSIPANNIVLSVQLKIFLSSQEQVESLQREYLQRRKNSQPYGQNCAGSVFKRILKNDNILFPAKMIDNLGLKGAKINDAEISTKHAGFIINNGNAKCKDVVKLIKLIKRKVKKTYGEVLQEEIMIK